VQERLIAGRRVRVEGNHRAKRTGRRGGAGDVERRYPGAALGEAIPALREVALVEVGAELVPQSPVGSLAPVGERQAVGLGQLPSVRRVGVDQRVGLDQIGVAPGVGVASVRPRARVDPLQTAAATDAATHEQSPEEEGRSESNPVWRPSTCVARHP